MLFAVLMVAVVLSRPLLPIDETRYLAVAWEMRLSGDLVHLTRNFESYAQKPPLLFWLIGLVWQATGVSEVSARLVAPAFAVAAVAGTAALGLQFWPTDRAAALRAAVILATTSVFVIYGSATMFDTMLTCAVLGGMAALWKIGNGSRGWMPWSLFGLALTIGAYAKGPVVLMHLAPSLLLMRLWAPEPPSVRRALAGLTFSLGLCLGLLSFWLLPVLISGDAAYRTEILWHQSAGRVMGGLAHDRPVWFFLALLPVLLFPWGWSTRVWADAHARLQSDKASRLAAVWAISGLVVFSLISGKQAHYLLPELPAVALLLGRSMSDRPVSRRWQAVPIALVPAGLAVGLLGIALGWWQVGAIRVDLAPDSALYVVAVFAGLLALAIVFTGMKPIAPQAVAGVGLVCLLQGLIAGTGLYEGFDARRIAAEIARLHPAEITVTGMEYNAEFNFALRRTAPVAVTPYPEETIEWAADHPDGLVIGPVNQARLKTPPVVTLRWSGRDFGLWPAASLVPGQGLPFRGRAGSRPAVSPGPTTAGNAPSL